jgi:hypothetical protein
MGSKALKKISGVVLPNLGAVGGFANGLVQGEGLKGALTGGLKSGLSTAATIAGAKLAGSGFGNSLLGNVGASSGGVKGALSGAGSGLSSLTSAVGGLKNILSPASTIFSGIQSYNTEDKMKKQLQDAQRRSEAALNPYAQAGNEANSSLAARLNAGFAPDDLASDPGYQFRLAEGQKSINRSLGAQGSLFSGKALKAASEYGQGQAASEYDDAYKRWLAQNQQLAGQAGQGLSAASGLTNVYDNQGNINANATLGKNNILTSTLSSVLNGTGKRNIVGYRPDGTPIYDDAGENYKLVSA